MTGAAGRQRPGLSPPQGALPTVPAGQSFFNGFSHGGAWTPIVDPRLVGLRPNLPLVLNLTRNPQPNCPAPGSL